MNNKITCRNLFILIVAIINSQSCTIYETPIKYRKSAESDIKQSEVWRNQVQRYTHIEMMKTIFVNQVSNDEAIRPQWTFERIQNQKISSSMTSALKQIFSDKTITFRFNDEVNPRKPITNVFNNATYFDALNAIAASSGYSFEINDNVVIWSQFQVKTFKVAMVPGIEEFGIGKKGDKSVSSSSTTEVQKNTVISSKDEFAHTKGEINALYDTLSGVQLLLSDSGKASLLPSTTAIVVKDFPDNVKKAGEFIHETNQLLTKQVSMKMVVYDILTTDETMGSLDWKVLASDLVGKGVETGLASVFGDQVSTATAPVLLDFTRTTGRLENSQILLNALQSQGAVNVKTYPMSTAMNNRVAKLRSIERTNFILERSITSTVNIGTEGSIKQGTVETGFSLYMLPSIIKDKVIIRVTTNMSALVSLTKKGAVETEDNTGNNVYIEAPEVADKDFDNTVMIPNGKTLLLAAYSSYQEASKNANAGFDVLGTSKSSNKRRIETIIAITPTIIDGIF